MALEQNQPEDGIKLFRCNLLPSLHRPFVFITWRYYTVRGDRLLEVQFFIVHETRPPDSRGVVTDPYYLSDSASGPISIDLIVEYARDQATELLEAIAEEELQTAVRPQAVFQPVVLQEIQEEEVLLASLRERWEGKWRPLLEYTYSAPLRWLVEKLERSRLRDLRFRPLGVRTAR